jgi:glycosyltransferase involved in cell wall biosynthesis
MRVAAIIPALNEEETVGDIVRRCINALKDSADLRVVVTDNGSGDSTAEEAEAAGAEVVFHPVRGYGGACLEAIRHLEGWADVLVFLDADGSSRPEEVLELLRPVFRDESDLVLGARPEDSPMTLPQRWGTWLATFLIRLRWGFPYRDMGPFRAITFESFQRLGMKDTTWGWTVEMQILAVIEGIRVIEVPVSWLDRAAGVSKISGSVAGVCRAGSKILWTIGKYSLQRSN